MLRGPQGGPVKINGRCRPIRLEASRRHETEHFKLGKERRAARRGPRPWQPWLWRLRLLWAAWALRPCWQPSRWGLTVEPSTIQWEDDSTQTSTHQNQKKQEQKKPTVKAESEAATEQPAESKAESTAASVEEKAGSAAPSVSEAASSEAAPSEPAQEPAPADPMAGDGTGLEQENAFPSSSRRR